MRKAKKLVKLICALFYGAIFLFYVPGQTAQAQGLLNLVGQSTLAPATAPVGGIVANPQEYLTVSWSVIESVVDAQDVYTYSYTVNNPAGDVLLNNDGTLTSTPEIVDAYQVGFNTLPAGMLVGGPSGGDSQQNNGIAGLFWSFGPVAAGGSSTPLTFESDFGPTLGNANALDSDPPSPWASTSPNGQQVPVPQIIPEPATTLLLALVLPLLPFRSALRRFV